MNEKKEKKPSIDDIMRVIPEQFYTSLLHYVVDRRTGNIILSIKEGRIMSMKVEDFRRF